jgi:hypothetical protein
VNWPPFRPDSRYNLEGLRLCSSTGLGKDTAYNGGDPCRHFKATDVASVSKVIHTDNQRHAGQFGKAAYTGWIQTNESSATLSGPRAQAPLLRKFDRLHWLS